MSIFLSKPAFYVYAVIAAVVLLWAVHTQVYNSGYDDAVLVKDAEIAELKRAATEARNAEVERQDAANNAAKLREAQRIAEMQAENELLQSQIEELGHEADQDPNAGRVVLGAPSVQRINKVR
jgi:3-methyladenine DNA glycosylase Mpg